MSDGLTVGLIIVAIIALAGILTWIMPRKVSPREQIAADAAEREHGLIETNARLAAALLQSEREKRELLDECNDYVRYYEAHLRTMEEPEDDWLEVQLIQARAAIERRRHGSESSHEASSPASTTPEEAGLGSTYRDRAGDC